MGTRLFVPLRSLYQRVCDREKLEYWDRMLKFYGSSIRPGDIVFDIGANVGTYTEVFSRLGAVVVAVEPNPECCHSIRRNAGTNKRVIVENCAAGASPDVADLHICENSAMSTLSERWLESVSNSELHKHSKWINTIRVSVTTLDELARKYGEPGFVKIDAEGFDDRVLGGMTFRPAALSFEFNLNALDVALRCLDTRVLRDGYLFNYTVGQECRYQSQTWLNRNDMASVIRDSRFDEEYGEVLAKRSL